MSSEDIAGHVGFEVPAIRARGLTKIYHLYDRPQDRLWELFGRHRDAHRRDFAAVQGVDLDVLPGETVGIVGCNGSGKSTLLRLICGTLEPSAGDLQVNGHLAPLLTLGAGFNREFTGRENVMMNAAILGMNRHEIRERLPAIVEFADIGAFFERPVKSYSSGMVSRLAFAVAVHSDPEILVIDEVLAVGDEAFNRKCFGRIEEIKRAGSTILFVSHVAERVIELCDRAVLMDGGESIYQADPKSVVARYKQLVHAPSAKRKEVRREIVALDSDPAPEVGRVPVPFQAERATPTSRVELQGVAARIEAPHVTDLSGAPVELLDAGLVYRFRYEVEFAAPAERVRFGMMLKPVSGLELAGQVSHEVGDSIEKVAAGTRVRVDFVFRAALSPGAYFFNAGVLGWQAGQERYLHRIFDAAMVRVIEAPRGHVTGRVDLSVDGRPASVEIMREGV